MCCNGLVRYLLRNFDKKKLFIFDFDGVIADSVSVKTEAFALLYASFGKNVVEEVIDFHLRNGGMSRFDKISFFHRKLLGRDVTDKLVQDWADRFAEMVVDGVVAAPETPGLRKILRFCHSNYIICAINSAAPESEIIEIVKRRGLSDHFEMILGSPRAKEKNLAKMLQELKVCSEDAVFFGDSINDYEAAKQASVEFVGINYYSESEEFFPVFKNFNEFFAEITQRPKSIE